MSLNIDEKPLDRSFTAEVVKVDEEARTVELAFSSEIEVSRWFGIEVLRHDTQSVRLGRLNGGGAVLVNHDDNDQVGVVESSRIDGDRKGRAVVRFSKSQRGEEIFQDVKDGIRKLVSARYKIHDYKVEERAGQDDLVTVTDWEPIELSIVAIPADPSVGVGRSENFNVEERNMSAATQENPEETQVKAKSKKVEAPDIGNIQAKARKDERERSNQIRSMAENLNLEELGREAIDEGWSYADFNARALEKIGERNNKARAESKHDGEVDLTDTEKRSFSFVKLMDALAHPQDRSAQSRAAFEIEVSTEAAKGFGSDFNARGSFIPNSVLSRTLSAGTATDGAELVGTSLQASSFIDMLRNKMRVLQAGATMLPGLVGNVQIPRQTSGAAMGWITEDDDAPEGEAQFDQITLAPKDAACFTEVTRRLLQQSTPAINGLVVSDLSTAIALGLDLAGLYGSGAAGQPRGIRNTTGINNFDFAAAKPTYEEITQMIKEVMLDNALMGTPYFMIDPEGWEDLSTTPKQGAGAEGNFILGENNKIRGYDYFSTNQVTAEDYFFGDFSQLVIGEWGGLELTTDPFTHSLKGRVRYVVFKTVDMAVRQPGAFCFCNDGVV